MTIRGNLEAQLMWYLLFSGPGRVLEEPAADYGGMLERMEAAELLALMEQVQERLKAMGVPSGPAEVKPGPISLAPVDLLKSVRISLFRQLCCRSFSKNVQCNLKVRHIVAQILLLQSFKLFILFCRKSAPLLSY